MILTCSQKKDTLEKEGWEIQIEPKKDFVAVLKVDTEQIEEIPILEYLYEIEANLELALYSCSNDDLKVHIQQAIAILELETISRNDQ